jgi:serine/threonine protein kinase
MGCVSSKDKSAEPAPAVKADKVPIKNDKKEEINNSVDDPLGLSDDSEDAVRREPIEEFYELGREIGRGGFSVVVEGTCKKTSEKFAIKCIKKTMVEGEDIKLLRREIKIMKRVNHPNILKLFEVFEDDEEFFFGYGACIRKRIIR